MNRYYVAEGVKIYSIETWKLVHGEQGKQIIIKYVKEVCEYYIQQSTADNHAVREAACHCISELCTKVAAEVDKEPFKPFIAQMIGALLECFKDQSWPVRDCACLACGHFVATFPEESKPVFDELCTLWVAHLSDNIQSVREHSAQSIIQVMKCAYTEELKAVVVKFIDENIMKAKEQSPSSAKFSNLSNETQFGVAKPSDHEHDNGVMYSCGSLAPKLKKGGGCMDHGFTRPMEVWELSDGAIFLAREVSSMEDMHQYVVKKLESLSNLGYIDHFKHSNTMKENLFKSLVVILQNIGKKKFRGFVEIFLDPAFRNAKNQEHQNMSYAAQDFILAMEKTYGQGIFKAILEGHDERFVQDLQKYKEVGQDLNQDFNYENMGPGFVMNPNNIAMTKAPWAK